MAALAATLGYGQAIAQQPAAPCAATGLHRAGPKELSELSEVIAQRLLLSDKVAAAKYGTGTPIDDPVRERQLLE